MSKYNNDETPYGRFATTISDVGEEFGYDFVFWHVPQSDNSHTHMLTKTDEQGRSYLASFNYSISSDGREAWIVSRILRSSKLSDGNMGWTQTREFRFGLDFSDSGPARTLLSANLSYVFSLIENL